MVQVQRNIELSRKSLKNSSRVEYSKAYTPNELFLSEEDQLTSMSFDTLWFTFLYLFHDSFIYLSIYKPTWISMEERRIHTQPDMRIIFISTLAEEESHEDRS